jgi:exosortase/archaeosortase family protein
MKLNNLSYDLKMPGAKKAIVRFFIFLLLLYTLWFILNFFFLAPLRLIDKPLTNFITICVVKLINIFTDTPISWIEDSIKTCNYLTRNNIVLLGIYDSCNGIDLIFTYVSVIILLPYPSKRKIIFTIVGSISIIIINILRVSLLYFIYIYHKNIFDFSHHFLFTVIMDIMILNGWLLFIKKKKEIL